MAPWNRWQILVAEFDRAVRGGALRRLLDSGDAAAVREAYVSWVARQRFADWMDAWDQLVAHGRGCLQVEVLRCEQCEGRRISRGMICRTCAGTGKHRHQVWVRARTTSAAGLR